MVCLFVEVVVVLLCFVCVVLLRLLEDDQPTGRVTVENKRRLWLVAVLGGTGDCGEGTSV